MAGEKSTPSSDSAGDRLGAVVSGDSRAGLTALRDVMDRAANGDFTQRVDTDVADEEVAAVAASCNEMLDEIEERVATVHGVADVLGETSREVAEAAAAVHEASDDASRRTEDIAMSTAEQRQRLDTIAVEMETLSASIEEVSASATTVASSAATTLERGEEGESAAIEALEEIDDILETTDASAAKMADLEEQVREIGEIVDLISDIADQTNLLALNAKIEAARADESGAGFAVVAEHVQELANETIEAAERIDGIVDEVESQTDETVEELAAMQTNVESGVETIETALDALSDISAHIEDTTYGIQEIDQAAEQQATATQRIFSSVDEVADLGKTVNDQGQDVAETVRRQADAAADVSANARGLATHVDSLEATLGDLEIDDAIVAREQDHATTAATRESAAVRAGTDDTAATSMGMVADLDNSYWLSWAKGYRRAAEALDYRTTIAANDGDIDRQTQHLADGIESDVDAIVGQTYTNESSVEFTKHCVEAGIPTVLAVTIADWHTPHDAGEEWVQYIAPHFVNHAYTAATVLFEAMGGEGRFVHIEGNPGTTVNTGRNRGVELALRKYPGIELVGERRAGNFVEHVARDEMAALVRRYGTDVDGLFAQNLSMAEGALSVLSDHDIDVPIATIDASEQGLTRVRNGQITATVSGMAPWQAAWSLAKVHDYRQGHTLDPAERMMTFNAPLCVADPDRWRPHVDRIPVVDAEQYRRVVFDSEMPYDWRRMSVAEAGENWDPQIEMQPIRHGDLADLLGWSPADRPTDYSVPPALRDDGALDAVQRKYATQFQRDPLSR